MAAPPGTTCARCQAGGTELSGFVRLQRRWVCPACQRTAGARAGDRNRLWLVIGVVAEVAALAGFASDITAIAGLVVVSYVLIPLHELGHASAAMLLGFRVHRIALGVGPVDWRRRVAGVSVELRRYPCGGHTVFAAATVRWYRLRTWVVVAAGPLVNVATLWVGITVMGSAPADGPVGLLAWQVTIVSVAVLAANLLPRRAPGSEVGGTDGYRLLTIPFLSRDAVNRMIDPSRLTEALVDAEAGDIERALAALPSVDEVADADSTTRLAVIGLLLRAERWGDAEPLLRQAPQEELADPRVAALHRNNLAWCILQRGDRDRYEEADELSAMAYEACGWEPAIAGTRGSVLRALGRHAEAIPFLEQAARAQLEPTNRALIEAELARCAAALGDVRAARRHLTAAERIEPTGVDGPQLDAARLEVRRAETRHLLQAGWSTVPTDPTRTVIDDADRIAAIARLRATFGGAVAGAGTSAVAYLDTERADAVRALVVDALAPRRLEDGVDPLAWLRTFAELCRDGHPARV